MDGCRLALTGDGTCRATVDRSAWIAQELRRGWQELISIPKETSIGGGGTGMKGLYPWHLFIMAQVLRRPLVVYGGAVASHQGEGGEIPDYFQG